MSAWWTARKNQGTWVIVEAAGLINTECRPGFGYLLWVCFGLQGVLEGSRRGCKLASLTDNIWPFRSKRASWNLHKHFGFWHFLLALTHWPKSPQMPQCGLYTWPPYWPLNFRDRTSADVILLGTKFPALLHTGNNVIGFSFLKII